MPAPPIRCAVETAASTAACISVRCGTKGHTSRTPTRGCTPRCRLRSISRAADSASSTIAVLNTVTSATTVNTVRLWTGSEWVSSTLAPAEVTASARASIAPTSRPSDRFGTATSVMCGYRSRCANRQCLRWDHPVTEFGYTVEVPEGYDEAVLRTRLALRGEGFSILSEMHVGGLLSPEAGAERQYLIMGAWSGAVSEIVIDPQLKGAVHLPCNVVVQESGSSAIVAALDPADATDGAVPDGLSSAARDALGRVLRKVEAPGGG